MIQEEAFRCKNITEKLLDFSRCNDIKRERIDLAGLIQGVVEMIRHIGKYTGKTIIFHPREAVMAHVDGQEIKQVVLNLIVNALESMDASGTLRIDARYNQGMAEMVFTDNGCGMSPEVLENIFEPFFTKRRDGKGTGLGFRSRTGSSASITARSWPPARERTRARPSPSGLPIHPTEIAEEGVVPSKSLGRRRTEPAAAAIVLAAHAVPINRSCSVDQSPITGLRRNLSMEKSRQGGLRILFADDEAHLRDLMQMELPRLGHEVTVCPDGTAALARARARAVRRRPARSADAGIDRASRSWARSARSAPRPR